MIEAIKRFFANLGKKLQEAEDKIDDKAHEVKEKAEDKIEDVKHEDSADRGFAAMDPSKQREIASLGGRTAHASGHAHEFTSEEAREASLKSHHEEVSVVKTEVQPVPLSDEGITSMSSTDQTIVPTVVADPTSPMTNTMTDPVIVTEPVVVKKTTRRSTTPRKRNTKK